MMSPLLATLSLVTTSLLFAVDAELDDRPSLPARDIREAAQRILADPAFSRFPHFGDPSPSTTPAEVSPPSATDPAAENSSSASSPVDHPTTGEPRTWRDRMQERRNQDASNEPSAEPASDPQPDRGNRRSRRRRSGADRERNQSAESPPADAEVARTQAETGQQTGTGPSNSATPSPPQRNDIQSETPASSDRNSPAQEADPPTTRSTPEPAPFQPERSSADGLEEPSDPRPQRTASPGSPSLRGMDGVERPVRYVPKPPAPDSTWDFDFDWDWGWKNPLRGLGSLLGAIVHFVAYGALVVMAVLILVLAIRAILELLRQRRATRTRTMTAGELLDDDRAPGDLAADIYLQRALSLAGEQHYHAAVAQLLLGAMSTIERAQWIHYRRGLILHDYLRAVRKHPAQYQGFARILQMYEPIEYGRRTATEAVFSSALDGYQQGFSSSPAVG